jgi:glyoxylase-like metal-dependent hydrolase (beta-lactamase superfamily II)
MDSSGADVLAGLRFFNAQPHDIRAILLTHWHNDHAAGASAIRALSNAPVYYHEGDEPYFTGRSGTTGGRRWISDRIPEWGVLVLAKGLLGSSTPQPISADRLVRDGEVLVDDFLVVETPGHTNGHVAYFYRPEQTLFAGDALAVIDGNLRFMARHVTPDLNEARQSVQKCLALRPQIVCPGHREPLTAGTNEACAKLQARVSSNEPWPLFG